MSNNHRPDSVLESWETLTHPSIVDACLAMQQTKVNNCGGNDWICLCESYQLVLQCYDNCPGDAERTTAQNQVTAFCNAAAPYVP